MWATFVEAAREMSLRRRGTLKLSLLSSTRDAPRFCKPNSDGKLIESSSKRVCAID